MLKSENSNRGILKYFMKAFFTDVYRSRKATYCDTDSSCPVFTHMPPFHFSHRADFKEKLMKKNLMKKKFLSSQIIHTHPSPLYLNYHHQLGQPLGADRLGAVKPPKEAGDGSTRWQKENHFSLVHLALGCFYS